MITILAALPRQNQIWSYMLASKFIPGVATSIPLPTDAEKLLR